MIGADTGFSTLTRCGCAAILALLGLWAGNAAAQQQPVVIITVDVESNEYRALPKQLDTICAGGVQCGMLEIARMLEARHMAGTFFLNVYESKAWGAPALRAIAQELQKRGHDVALHTHPQWMYDPHRVYMYQYTLDEQMRIVGDGVRLLREWTGLPVVAHRTGAYSANADTMEALGRNGITLDFSFFPGAAECHLDGLGLPINLPGAVGKVEEIPVTVYERLERPAGLGRLLPAHRASGKIDVNSMDDESQALPALNTVVAAHTPYIVLFLHSFSFMRAPRAANQPPQPDEQAIHIFQKLLDGVAAMHLEVVTSRQIVERGGLGSPAKSGGESRLPEAQITVPSIKYIARVERSSSKAAKLVAGCVALLGTTWLLWWRLRRRNRSPALHG